MHINHLRKFGASIGKSGANAGKRRLNAGKYGALVFLALVGLLCGGRASAQIAVTLRMQTDDGALVRAAELSVVRSDTTVYFAMVSGAEHAFTLPDAGTYRLSLTSLGYQTAECVLACTADTTLTLTLTRKATELGEAVVEGQALSERTATGEAFRLSRKARACGDPYRALSEIPLLQVDIANQQVKLRDGSSPLVLVDGKLLNTGISPIDPKFIDRVEVSEVVSARYLQMGVTKILNIKLKRDVPLYTYTELRTRHDIPLRYGFGAVNFEVGTQKVALAGTVYDEYTHKDKVDTSGEELLNEVYKRTDGETVDKSNKWHGNLLLKWVPNASNYFAAKGLFGNTVNRTESTDTGIYGTAQPVPLGSAQRYRAEYGGLAGYLYHEYTFKRGDTFSTYLWYNRGTTDETGSNEESIGGLTDIYRMSENSKRDQYSLSLDYDSGDRPFGQVAAGNVLSMTYDQSFDRTREPHPRNDVGLVSNYTHASYTNQWRRKLYYMASVGLEYLSVDAPGGKNSFWRPRASASLTWALSQTQSVRANYYLTNSMPGSTQLASFNTSTNPLLRVEGNPYLVPIQNNSFRLSYDKAFGRNIRLQGYVGHDRYSKMIEAYLRNEGNVAVQSFRNNGTYENTSLGTNVYCRWDKVLLSGDASYNWEHYNGQGQKGSVSLRGLFRWDFGRFFLYSTIAWRNRSYSSVSVTRYDKPLDASVQIAWQITRSLYITACLPYYWGVRSNETELNRAGYYSLTRNRYKSASLRPWILIAWTLRKNARHVIANLMPNS